MRGIMFALAAAFISAGVCLAGQRVSVEEMNRILASQKAQTIKAQSPTSAIPIPTGKPGVVGQAYSVGDISYMVVEVRSSNSIAEGMADKEPQGRYLFVDMLIKNTGESSCIMPPMYVYDEEGRKFDMSSRSWVVDQAFRPFESLKPGMQRRGYLVFDVPIGSTCRLEVTGSMRSRATGFIMLGLVR